MAEELGKIEKPTAADYRKGRKLYFVPLIYGSKESPADYLEKFDKLKNLPPTTWKSLISTGNRLKTR